MPTRKGPPRATPVEVPPVIVLYLLEGRYPRVGELADPFPIFITDEAEGRDIWRAHRRRWLRAWVRDHPGSRPAGWWEHEAPEPRRQVGGSGGPAWQRYPAYAHEYCHGLPNVVIGTAQFESQATFLRRHRQLSPAELARIPTEAWAPETVVGDEDMSR